MKHNISASFLHFSMQNIEQSHDLARTIRQTKINIGQ